jgi:hypothetical protein
LFLTDRSKQVVGVEVVGVAVGRIADRQRIRVVSR